jgi:hypothetical protein
MSDLELELRDLAAHLDVPPTPPLVGAVLAHVTRPRRSRRPLAVAVPDSRATMLRFFHVRGASVAIIDRLPPLTSRRSLGQPIPLDRTVFQLLLPSGRRPEKVYAGDGGYWLRYPGLLLFEFESGAGAQIVKKATIDMTGVEYVRVRGEPGIWIGTRHALYLPGGPPVATGHVLIWQHGLVTVRLEAGVRREQALAIARSVR